MNPVGAEEVPASMQALIFEMLALHRPSGWFVYEKHVVVFLGGDRGGWYVLLIFSHWKSISTIIHGHHKMALPCKKMGHLFTQRVVPGSLTWEWPSKNWDSSSLRELCEDPYLQMALQKNGIPLHWESCTRILILRMAQHKFWKIMSGSISWDGPARVTWDIGT